MTLSTNVRVTSIGVTPRQVFDEARRLIGATDASRFTRGEHGDVRTYSMVPGQRLCALMHLEYGPDGLVTAHRYCEDGEHTELWPASACGPDYLIDVDFDTGYAWREANDALVLDLQRRDEPALAARLDGAYARVERGEPTAKIAVEYADGS